MGKESTGELFERGQASPMLGSCLHARTSLRMVPGGMRQSVLSSSTYGARVRPTPKLHAPPKQGWPSLRTTETGYRLHNRLRVADWAGVEPSSTIGTPPSSAAGVQRKSSVRHQSTHQTAFFTGMMTSHGVPTVVRESLEGARGFDSTVTSGTPRNGPSHRAYRAR